MSAPITAPSTRCRCGCGAIGLSERQQREHVRLQRQRKREVRHPTFDLPAPIDPAPSRADEYVDMSLSNNDIYTTFLNDEIPIIETEYISGGPAFEKTARLWVVLQQFNIPQKGFDELREIWEADSSPTLSSRQMVYQLEKVS
ncbi:hypothetical protein RUND412_007104 [Rhizina undulata]